MTEHRDVDDREEAVAERGLDTLHDRNIFRDGWEAARLARFDEIGRLNAEWMAKCEELRKDALRYKWIRDEGDLSVRDVFGSWCRELNDGLDAAIDAALAKKEGA